MNSHWSPKSLDFGLFISALLLILLAACQSQAALALTPPEPVLPSPTKRPTVSESPTFTLSPTASPTPAPTLFPLPTIAPQATLTPCDRRRPAADDLFSEVSDNYGLEPNYVPADLVTLGNYLPGRVTLPDMRLRQPAAQALGKMVKAMLANGLAPTVLSAYRSYFDQAVAHNRWVVQDPANANDVSALPGHSEHQLGTTVDFGSPEMPALTGSTTDLFSTLFDRTSEGKWLAQHAYEYGFSMSSPPGAQALTGLAYEPWHYRYVGVEMATYLQASGYYLDEYLLKVRPLMPCQP
jgi:D-alanyl-D-alanine carboxypeptidase